jgi:hypothetical protein
MRTQLGDRVPALVGEALPLLEQLEVVIVQKPAQPAPAVCFSTARPREAAPGSRGDRMSLTRVVMRKTRA